MKVTYKERLADKGAWRPLTLHQENERGRYNDTEENGILFVLRPPDLRSGVMQREEFSAKVQSRDDDKTPGGACKKVLRNYNDVGATANGKRSGTLYGIGTIVMSALA